MDFARRQLEKYGWSEGQGLGKDLTGITTALKPRIKLDQCGIGHDIAQEFTYHWWEDAYNNACSNVNIEQTKDGVKVATIAESSEISAVKRAQIERDKLKFGSFVKRETMTKSGSILAPDQKADPIEEAGNKLPKLAKILTDEELFEACGRLTAHKGARHGLTLSGKLQRVKEQEEALLKAFQNPKHIERSKKKDEKGSGSSIYNADKESSKRKYGLENQETNEENEILENDTTKRRKKKKKRDNEICIEECTDNNQGSKRTDEKVILENEIQDETCDETVKRSKKKKKKDRKESSGESEQEEKNRAVESNSPEKSFGNENRKKNKKIKKYDILDEQQYSDKTEGLSDDDKTKDLICDTETTKTKKKKKKHCVMDEEHSSGKSEGGQAEEGETKEGICDIETPKKKKKRSNTNGEEQLLTNSVKSKSKGKGKSGCDAVEDVCENEYTATSKKEKKRKKD